MIVPIVVKTKHIMVLNFYPILMTLNQLVEKILDFEMWIADLLYRFALSFLFMDPPASGS